MFYFWREKLKVIKKLGGKCKQCGITDYRVLDINHIDRLKKNIPLKRNYSWEFRVKDWQKNIENLELLCSNCHRIHTWEQMDYGKYV
jgi:5-methylcytosine-specific restriction endonuclease McrA